MVSSAPAQPGKRRSSDAERPVRGRWSRVLPGVLLALTPLLLYARGLNYSLVRDDRTIIADNPAINHPGHRSDIFTGGYWPESSGKDDSLYRPLTLLTYALQYDVQGLSPFGFHLANVLLHSLVCVALFLLAREWGGSSRGAFWVAMLFCCHPVNVEAVQYVTGRADLLATLGTIVALLLHGRARLAKGVRRYSYLAGAVFAFACAVASKESAIPFLAMVAISDAWRGRGEKQESRRLWWGAYGGYLVVVVFYFAVRWVVFDGEILRGSDAVSSLDNPLVREGIAIRFLGALTVLGRAIGLFLVPASLSTDYSMGAIPVPSSIVDGGVAWGFLCLAGLVFLLVVTWRSRSEIGLGSMWFLVSWSIVSNVVVPIGTIFGLRLLYLPVAGLCFAFAGLIQWACGRFEGKSIGRRLAPFVLASLCLGSAALSVHHIGMWENERTLIFRSLDSEPDSARLNYLAGGILAGSGEERRALGYLERSLEIFAENHSARAMVGMILVRAGETARGIAEIEKAYLGDVDTVRPSFSHLIKALRLQGKRDEALRFLRGYLDRYPEDSGARGLLTRVVE